MSRVSVILTSYNRPAFLRQAISSVLTQTMQDFELLIMEDSSSDPAVLGVLADYWTDSRVMIHKEPAPVDRAARCRYAYLASKGLSLASSPYVTYLCDDDWYLPRRLEIMTARLDAKDCQVVYAGQRVMDATGEHQIGERPARAVLAKASFVVDHSSVMHTRQAGLNVGGWDDDPGYWTCADAVFWDRLTSAGHLFFPAGAEPLDCHRMHPRTATASQGPY